MSLTTVGSMKIFEGSFVLQGRYREMLFLWLSLISSSLHLRAELPHWWGRRRGRTKWGGTILWGAADRDGMGGTGGGVHGGRWRRSEPPPPHHAVNTPVHDTRHTPPAPHHHPFTHFLPSRARCLLFLLGWTDLCMPLLDPTVGSV